MRSLAAPRCRPHATPSFKARHDAALGCHWLYPRAIDGGQQNVHFIDVSWCASQKGHLDEQSLDLHFRSSAVNDCLVFSAWCGIEVHSVRQTARLMRCPATTACSAHTVLREPSNCANCCRLYGEGSCMTSSLFDRSWRERTSDSKQLLTA